MSENDSCCCSCSATKPAVTLNVKQEALAEALYQAYRRNFYGQENNPLNMADWEGVVTDDDTAYAVQDAVMAKKMGPVAGYKVSLTSEETQRMFDSGSPLYGAQVAERFVPTPCTLDLRHLNEPLVEVEFCFTAKKDLSADMSLDELLHNCTVAGDMEVPDARFAAWFPTLSKYLVMSDCAVGGYVLYGTPVDGAELTVEGMAQVHAKAYHNGEFVKEGDSSEVLGNPVNSLKWLVGKLESQGKKFTKGMHVSVGTVFVPPAFTAGEWRVEFSGPFGTLEVTAK
ncbi:2-keto-4-pentenoate hydratase [Olsenella uli]|uniref:2-keto-4-pentenoate hydratase n=1 Tax=Olsenella uli TaxID=133926 RepID=UPI0012AC2E8D|nr:2-keto-4-pentenoate hydratase [Olsenella uli]